MTARMDRLGAEAAAYVDTYMDAIHWDYRVQAVRPLQPRSVIP